MHELFCITDNKLTPITPIVGTISRRSNVNELGEQLTFDLANSMNKYFPKNPVDLGSLIILKNKQELFRGIVIVDDRQSTSLQYSCFDYGFYLNKSEAVYKFKGITADAALRKIFTDFKVPVGSIASMKTLIKKIYPGETVSEIIKDILDIVKKATGIKYRIEMRLGKVYVEKDTATLIKATFKLYQGDSPRDIMEAIANPSRRRSIENMKNSIKIISGDDKSVKVNATAKDDALIKKYGLLQEVEKVDKKEIAQSKTIAANMLKELGKIFEENGIEVPGDDKVKAGRLMEVTEITTGMSGKYLINDAAHTIKGTFHRMQLGLGVL